MDYMDPMSSVLKKADKLNLSLSLSGHPLLQGGYLMDFHYGGTGRIPSQCDNDAESVSMSLHHFDGLVRETRNSIANALELQLSCSNISIWKWLLGVMTSWIFGSDSDKSRMKISLFLHILILSALVCELLWIVVQILCLYQGFCRISVQMSWFLCCWNINTLRLRQNGCHFPNIFECIFLNENV